MSIRKSPAGFTGGGGRSALLGAPELGAGPSRGNASVRKGDKEQKLARPNHYSEDREPRFTKKYIASHPFEVARLSRTDKIPSPLAHRDGMRDGKKDWSNFEYRSSRGFRRVGYAVGGLIIGLVGLNMVTGGDGGSTTSTADSGPSTTATTETSMPGVFTDPGGSVEVTTTVASEATTTVAARVAISAVAVDLLPGDSGPEVAQLQAELVQAGCSVGPDGPDGTFGKNTTAGLMVFQTNAQLVPDGQYGVASRADLSAALTAGDKTCGVGF